MAVRHAGLVMTLLVALALLGACGAPAGPTPTPARTPVRIASLRGPTTMGLVGLMADAEAGRTRHDYRVSVVGTPDEIVPRVVQGEADVAMVPANLAAALHNRTGGAVRVIAVNTLGNLYVVESGRTVASVADLRGRTVYATGKGASPEFCLEHILRANGLEPGVDVALEWKSEHAELAALLAAGADVVAMLPQPFVALVQAQNPSVRVALDLDAEWERVSPDAGLVMGVAIADTGWATRNPGLLADFLSDYEASTRFVDTDLAAAAELVVQYGLAPDVAVASSAIPASHLTFLTGPAMRAELEGYLKVLFAAEPASVGGALPGDDFYHQP